jgi:hypothetical protein
MFVLGVRYCVSCSTRFSDAKVYATCRHTKQRNTDHHKREVMPLANGEDSCEQDFECNRRKGGQEHGSKHHSSFVDMACPVMGTKRTPVICLTE